MQTYIFIINHCIHSRTILALKATKARNLDPSIARRLGSWLHQHKLEDIETKYVSVPLLWGGPLGQAMGEDVMMGMYGLKSFIMASVGMSEEQVDQMLENIKQDFITSKSYMNYHVAHGRAPLHAVEKKVEKTGEQ